LNSKTLAHVILGRLDRDAV